ncbi:hypothetical protein DSS3P8_169 [Roseobacter phage DSS3P8]|nr:hypothetical protein DSS3P8_169 [Roseobacter phage DSS3P8]
MTFEQWAEAQDFYKGDTAESFEWLWDMLIERGDDPVDVADTLDSLVGAIRHEYGE